jgi:hypothetical protein
LLRRQKLENPTGGLFNEAQIVLQDGVNGANRKAMGGGKFPNRYPPVILNGGGDGSQNVDGPLRLLGAGVVLIFGVFALLNSLDDTVYLAF